MAELFEGGSGALIEGAYRYHLYRIVADHPKRCAFVMLNPSTADAEVDDPTIRRCKDFARRWGFGAMEVANVYAYRTSSPAELFAAQARGEDIIGPENHNWLAFAGSAQRVVLAWGKHAEPEAWGNALGIIQVNSRLPLRGYAPLLCLGVNKDGSPRHPLYVPASFEPVPWEQPQ